LLQNRLVENRNATIIGTFPKSVRLRKRADFVDLLNSKHKFVVKGFLVVWQNNDCDNPRLGVTVSKKVGCSVVRNRIKRLIREVFRRHRLYIPAVDLNVIARREAVLMGFQSVELELEKAFIQIGATTCSKPFHYL
jgi:ribonuclease P protein component